MEEMYIESYNFDDGTKSTEQQHPITTKHPSEKLIFNKRMINGPFLRTEIGGSYQDDYKFKVDELFDK